MFCPRSISWPVVGPTTPAWDGKENSLRFPSEWWRQLSTQSWDPPFTVTTCTLSVISGTVKYETEPQYVKNSQAFLRACNWSGVCGEGKRQRKECSLQWAIFFLSHLFCLLLNCLIKINKAGENYIWQPSIGFEFVVLFSLLIFCLQ